MSSSAAMGGDAIPAAMEEAARLKYGSEGTWQLIFCRLQLSSLSRIH